MTKLNKWLLNWILCRIIRTNGWISHDVQAVFKAVGRRVRHLYYEDNHATTLSFLQDQLDAVKDQIINPEKE